MYIRPLAFLSISSKCKSQLHGLSCRVTPKSFSHVFRLIEGISSGKTTEVCLRTTIPYVFSKFKGILFFSAHVCEMITIFVNYTVNLHPICLRICRLENARFAVLELYYNYYTLRKYLLKIQISGKILRQPPPPTPNFRCFATFL